MKLVGTYHWDIAGTARLEYLLARMKPRKVTVEWPVNTTLDDIENRIRMAREERIEAVESLTDIPDNVKRLFLDLFSNSGYDILVPIQYARAHGGDVFPVDHPRLLHDIDKDPSNYSGFIQSLKAGLGEVPPEVAQIPYNLLKQSWSKELDRAYTDPNMFREIDQFSSQRGLSLVKGLEFLNEPLFEEEREQWMADEIQRLNPDVHIAGIAHIAEGYFEQPSFQPLYQRLGNSISQRIRLVEADQIVI